MDSCTGGAACMRCAGDVLGFGLRLALSSLVMIACLPSAITPALGAPSSPTVQTIPDITFLFDPVGWSACSETCGTGYQVLLIKCMRGVGSADNYASMTFDIVDDQKCFDAGLQKPTISPRRECRKMPCLKNYWVKGHWTQCNTSCGGGYRRRPVMCYNPSTMTSADPSQCRKVQPRYLQRCNTSPCDGMWMVGGWNNCSATCGVGVHHRRVVCRSSTGTVFSSQSSRGAINEPSGCRYLVQPARAKLCCSDSHCPPEKENICADPLPTSITNMTHPALHQQMEHYPAARR